MSHVPVLLNETISFLAPKKNGIYVDATLGEGGHATRILESSDVKVIGIEKDEEILEVAKKNLLKFKNKVVTVNDNFKNIDKILTKENIEEIDGAIFDLGVSSFQIDSRERGFSFKYDANLDMRMSKEQKITAFDVVNKLSCSDIERIIRTLGEERFSKEISRNICRERRNKEIKTTSELVRIINNSIPNKYKHRRIHPATRTFQALRIIVNDELNSLREVLEKIIGFLKPQGRLCVISFHSLEDRIIKHFFLRNAKTERPVLRIITKKPVTAGTAELKNNPRSRSAKLRVAEKI